MDARTLRAAVVADVSTMATLGLLGWFLGFPVAGSFIVGAVAGGLAFVLIVLAARRAEGFDATAPERGNADPGD